MLVERNYVLLGLTGGPTLGGGDTPSISGSEEYAGLNAASEIKELCKLLGSIKSTSLLPARPFSVHSSHHRMVLILLFRHRVHVWLTLWLLSRFNNANLFRVL